MKPGFAWECSCGNIEYGDESPEECAKCNKLDSFVQMPQEILEERAREILEEEIPVNAEKPIKNPSHDKANGIFKPQIVTGGMAKMRRFEPNLSIKEKLKKISKSKTKK